MSAWSGARLELSGAPLETSRDCDEVKCFILREVKDVSRQDGGALFGPGGSARSWMADGDAALMPGAATLMDSYIERSHDGHCDDVTPDLHGA